MGACFYEACSLIEAHREPSARRGKTQALLSPALTQVEPEINQTFGLVDSA